MVGKSLVPAGFGGHDDLAGAKLRRKHAAAAEDDEFLRAGEDGGLMEDGACRRRADGAHIKQRGPTIQLQQIKLHRAVGRKGPCGRRRMIFGQNPLQHLVVKGYDADLRDLLPRSVELLRSKQRLAVRVK